MKRKKKRVNCLNLAWGLKIWNKKMTMILSIIDAVSTIQKGLVKGFENKKDK